MNLVRITLRALVLLAWFPLAACAFKPVDRFPDRPDESIPNSRSSLHKPDGAGPFPAVVMLHTCGGIASHLNQWRIRLVDAGYVVLIVDSFTPRGERGGICERWSITVDHVASDAVAAASHLRTLGFVDPARIGVVGFSYGAMAALRLAGQSYVAGLTGGGSPFRAAVAFYPYCTPEQAGSRWTSLQDNLRRDVATPLLMLLGGADSEAPVRLCTAPADELIKRGQPVRYVVFPGVTHAFDQDYAPRGYLYDAKAVNVSWVEMSNFLDASMR
jgi:dienelactone hydrolase